MSGMKGVINMIATLYMRVNPAHLFHTLNDN
jgi:hypothetical protein